MTPTIEELIRKLVREELQLELAKQPASKPASSVSIADYAKARSISVSTVRNAIRSGRLKAMKIGSAVRVPAGEEIGRPLVPPPTPATSSQIAERIIAKEHKRGRLVAV
jgi:hypothetical protein